MHQKGDLERYLKNSLAPSLEIKTPNAQDTLFGEELEIRKYNTPKDARWATLGVDYDGGNLSFAEATFYPAQFDSAQKGSQEYAAMAVVERVLTPYDAGLGDDLYIFASGEDMEFLKKAVECINAFLK